MDIGEKSIISIRPNTHLNRLLFSMRDDATKAYNNYLQRCGKEAVVIIKLCYFIRSSTHQFYKDEDNSYIQIEVELRKKGMNHTDNYYVDKKDGISEKIEKTLIYLYDLFSEDYTRFEKKYLCNKVCFSGRAAATLVHEYSHLFEADIYLYSRKYLDQFNPMLKLQDLWFHQRIPKFCNCLDDELISSKSFVILEKGLLKNIIVDKKWATIYHLAPKGNGRIAFEENAIVMPRMRISHISFNKTISNYTRHPEENYLVIDNIKSGKLSPKEGIVTFNIESSKYYSSQEITKLGPFVISVHIHKLMNNIFGASNDEYCMACPCGKNGAQTPCGIVTPTEIYSLKDGINVLV